jgi:hypothetical protein
MSLWPFRPNCPIDAKAQAWLDDRMKWLAGEFGIETWRKARAIEPTEEFFPDQFDGTESAVQLMLNRICDFMHIDPSRVVLRLYTEDVNPELKRKLHLGTNGKGTAGHYRVEEKEIVGIEASKLGDPTALVATIAHELAHVRLLGEKRLTGEEEDHEPLTDLTTVFFGLGVFNANSAFRFDQWSQGNWHGWKAATLGYLNEQMFGYALGLWTIVRGEASPSWTKHLRPNPRAYMKQAVRYLKANPPSAF